ncbi:MAG: DNA internalization-related competence protein ComEC/Rec2 [Nitrospinota bacterium]
MIPPPLRIMKNWFLSGNASIHDRARIPPILPYLLSFMAGLVVNQSNSYFVCAIVLGLSFYFFIRSIQSFSILKTGTLVFILLSGWMYPTNTPTHPDNIVHHIEEGTTISLQGKLFTPPQVLEDRTFYFLEAESISTKRKTREVSGRVRIAVYKAHDLLGSGEIVRFQKIRLKVPRNFKNPGRFDYRTYLNSKGVDLIGNVSKPESIIRLGKFELPFYYSFTQSIRGKILISLTKLFPGEEGKLLQAMVFGMKDSLSPKVRQAYIDTGLAHLMAVSGLHIGFVTSAFYFLLLPLVFQLLYRFKPDDARAGHSGKWTAFFCLIPVLLYMVIVGAKVSSLRAGIMVSAFLIAILINRKSSLFNALISAAFIILLWDPQSLIDPGFQLSFVAVAGILWVIHLLSEMGNDPLSKLGDPPWHQKLLGVDSQSQDFVIQSKLKKIFFSSLLISFTVFFATLPVLLFHFHQISLVGPFLNLFLVPLAALLIPGVLLVTCLGIFSQGIAMLPALPFYYLTKIFLIIPQYVSELSFSSVYLASPPSIWIWIYYSVLISGGYALLNKVQHKEISPAFKSGWLLATILSLSLLIWPRMFHFPENKLNITVLDIGQGESIFIEFPDGKNMLMDGGGFYKNSLDVGKKVIAPFLWNKGINEIDYMVATHSDNDHIRGLDSVLDLFPVKTFLTFSENLAGYRLQYLYSKAKEKNAKLISLKSRQPINIGKVQITPLHPTSKTQHKGKKRVVNDLSLVTLLEYETFSMLFTGDIGEKVENKLVDTYPELKVDVLKGPHHGSRFSNSKSFIQATRPQAVVFSSGYLNRMKHPHPKTLNRYKQAGTNIYRTDLQGAIQITSDGRTHSIKTHENL